MVVCAVHTLQPMQTTSSQGFCCQIKLIELDRGLLGCVARTEVLGWDFLVRMSQSANISADCLKTGDGLGIFFDLCRSWKLTKVQQ